MFYTKYRPQTFSDISKPNETAQALSTQISTGKTVHAYLFVGSRGTGKTTTARILAKAINCTSLKKSGDPCNECANCLGVQTGSLMDVIEIDAASNRGIDDIRDLKDRVKLAPAQGKRKVYIIDEVHMLTTEAFNALLKTLEEPPKHVVFILCTTELHKVPDTVKSRCQVFKFKRASISQIVQKLETIAKAEKAKVDVESLKIIATAAYGGFRDAETLLQQVIEGNIDPKSLLSTNSKSLYLDFVSALTEGHSDTCLKIVNNLVEDGVDLNLWTGELMRYLRDVLFLKMGVNASLIDLAEDYVSETKVLADKIDKNLIVTLIERLAVVQTQIKSFGIPQLPLEILILEFNFKPHASIATPEPRSNNPEEPKTLSNKSVVTKKVEVRTSEVDTKPKPSKDSHIPFDTLKEKWHDVITTMAKLNSSIQSLLKQATLKGIGADGVELEVSYAFHKERLESPRNRQMVEEALMQVFGIPQTIKCYVNSDTRPIKPVDTGSRLVGDLTDYNVAPVQNTSGNILDIFDGGLPLVK